jgi:hypothetical protein
MSETGRWSWILFLLFLLCFVPADFAQNTTASLTGVVTDPSGAVITNAEVELSAELGDGQA